MAVGAQKCTGCKKFFPSGQMIVVPVGKFHSEQCKYDYAMKKTDRVIAKADKLKKKVHAKQKRKFYDNDLKTRKDAAKKACHVYIRARDAGRPCICCNRSTATGKINAGHFHESSNNPRIRYDEDNIHLQLEYCNTYQHGDSDNYRGNLIKKIGIDKVERLDSLKGGTIKRTCDDYREIEKHYKLKFRALEALQWD